MPETDPIADAIMEEYPDLTRDEAVHVASNARGFAEGKLRRRDPFLTELRQLREAASLPQVDVAAHMHISESKLARIEGGGVPVSRSDLLFMLEIYGASDEARDRLLVENNRRRAERLARRNRIADGASHG